MTRVEDSDGINFPELGLVHIPSVLEATPPELFFLCNIPGYKSRKGIEVELFEGTDGLTYDATHYLPSIYQSLRGLPVLGVGKTRPDAITDLGQKISELYSSLWSLIGQGETLSPEQQLQKRYLDTILIKI